MKPRKKRRGIRALAAVFSLLLCVCALPAWPVRAAEVPEGWPEPPEIASETGVVMDLSTGEILYNKDMDKQMYPASITKVMTALLALEHASLDEQVTFTELGVRDVYSGSSNAGMQVGETLTMEQCLYVMMLKSANEVATQIGEYIAGSESGFAEMMNQRAQELGCTNTHFSNASGLHAADHYTSAHDMALIGQAAFQYDEFRKIIATKTYELPPTNMNPNTRTFQNHHVMILDGGEYTYPYCLGGKTGNTDEAHNTLITFAQKDGLQLVAVVMKSDGTAEWTDTRALFDYVYDHAELLKPTETPVPTSAPTVAASDGNGDRSDSPAAISAEQEGREASAAGISQVLRVIAAVFAGLIVVCLVMIAKGASRKRRRRRRRRRR